MIFETQFWQYLVQALFLGLWQGRPVLRSTITVVWAEWALLLGHLWHSVLAKLCNVYTFQIFLFTKGCSIFQEAQVGLRSRAQLVWRISVRGSACKKVRKVCILSSGLQQWNWINLTFKDNIHLFSGLCIVYMVVFSVCNTDSVFPDTKRNVLEFCFLVLPEVGRSVQVSVLHKKTFF